MIPPTHPAEEQVLRQIAERHVPKLYREIDLTNGVLAALREAVALAAQQSFSVGARNNPSNVYSNDDHRPARRLPMTTFCDISALSQRRDGQVKWLKEYHPECQREQKHLDEGSAERAYWHYGYMVALTDLLNFLGAEKRTLPSLPSERRGGSQ
jgi:hypothetical protein